jgi:hypothetical protein
VEILSAIEATESTLSIAFATHSGVPIGTFLVTGGCPCLVTLSERQMPLGERLTRRWPESAFAVRKALSVARAEQRPLGDVLLHLDAVDSEHIRAALLDQIAEGLAAFGRHAPDGVNVRWITASEKRVPTILSAFPASEVYQRSAALLAPAPDAIRTGFAARVEGASEAHLFARDASGAPFLIESTGAPLSIVETAQLARATARLAQPSALDAAGVKPRLVMVGGPGGAALCAVSRDWLALVACLERSARARVLGRASRLIEEVA